MADLLIRDCDILSFESNKPVIHYHRDIIISGNKIATIKKTGEWHENNIYRIIPAKGLLACPGLINTHAHVPMVLFRGMVEDVSVQAWFNDYIFPMETNLTPEDVYWGALLGLAEMIEAGITTVADHYFFMNKVAEAVELSGLRANLTWAVFGHEGEEKLDQTCEFVSSWHGAANNRIMTWLGPHAPYTTGPEFLKLSAKKALELKTGIHIHASETQEQVSLSLANYKITPIKMLEETGVFEVPVILAHCLYPEDDDFRIISNHQVGVAHAPKTYLKLGMGTAPLQRFLSENIPVGLATDSAVSSNTLDILEQMRLMVLAQKNYSNSPEVAKVSDALCIAFEGGAKVMRLSDTIGNIKEGKLADIILVRQDGLCNFPRYNPAANFVYSISSRDVETVICNGDVLMINRKLLTIDKDLVKQEIADRLARLNKRIPNKRIATYPA